MISQEMPPRASSAAPVEYADVRTSLRLGRAALCGLLLAVAAAGWAMGIPGSAVKASAAGLVMVHALVDRLRSPLPALAITAVVLTATVGTPGHFAAPLAALAGCVLAASFVVLPARQAAVTALMLGTGTALRLYLLSPAADSGTSAAILAGIETASYVAALAIGGVASSRAVHSARRRQAEALAAEQRAAQMKNEFVSMVSHELRTPLTNIAGFALALRESWRTFDPAEVDEFLEVVCREAEHLRSLVDDVLVVPRLEAGRLPIEPADFPLRPAAYRIAGLVFPAGGSKSVTVAVGGNAVVRADPNRVEQVLRNLLENAARYGGTQVSVEADLLGMEWTVTVADDGPGIAPDDRERIFAAFEQAGDDRNPGQGLGLGLTVSRVLVQAMGGRIWYEPGFPTGARFCFTLPAAQARQGVPVDAAL
jgi:signal transduction histidine kinase